MKIAVLLRGQLRHTEYGAKLFKRFVTDRFPDCEFKFFIHTWPGTTCKMTTTNSMEFTYEYKSIDDILKNYLPYWTPSGQLISKETELLNLVKHIIYCNLQDSELITWWNLHCEKYNNAGSNRIFDYCLFPPNYNLINTTDDMFAKEYVDYDLMKTAIRMHFLLGQLYSACKSYQVLQEYIDINDTSYSPDLIWSTRVDCFTWFDNQNIFQDMVDYINHEKKQIPSPMCKNIVLSRVVRVDEGRPWVDDYNFFMLPDAAQSFFLGDNSTVENRIECMFTKNKHIMFDIIGSSHIAHQLWAKLGSHCVFCQMPSHIFPVSALIRTRMDMSICNNTTLSDKELFFNLSRQASWWKNPVTTAIVDYDTIYKVYCDILNH